MSDYSQGIAQDWSRAILHHGIPMKPDEIVLKLNHYADLKAQLTAANARVKALETHMTELKERYPSSPWIYKLTTTALEQEKSE